MSATKLKNPDRLYFPHIEGLRAVAALLVAVYHIYLGRVSGGVDVFFVVSGFLITLSLLHKVDDAGRPQWEDFFSGLAMRLLPAAGLVLVLVVVLTFLFLPETRYFETLREVLASFLYMENWQLAVQAVDYLERDNAQSPVQHFWAMSVQGQFYAISICVFFAATQVARWTSHGTVSTLAGAYAIVVAASLGYSIYQTHFGDQVWAYYDTFARVWEFCLGGLFGLAVHQRRDLVLPAVFGWVGLAIIMLVGMIFQVGSVFPGAAALVPTLAAVLVLFGGRSDAAWSVGRLLGSSVFLSLGAVSYGIYLLHWPFLVVYREVAQRESVGAAPGLLIILASVVGAYAIRRWIEMPFLEMRKKGLQIRRRAITKLSTPLLLIFASLFAYYAIPEKTHGKATAEFPGAQALSGAIDWEIDLDPDDIVPDLATIKQDLPRSYGDGCHVGLKATDARWCTYGKQEDFERTLAVVGGSHSAHWLPALEEIAMRNQWRILYSTWSSCRFEVPGLNARCEEISTSAVKKLREARPDLVFTTANVGRGHEFRGRKGRQVFSSENVDRDSAPPESYLNAWMAMSDNGIRVFAVRDNPWLEADVPDCISANPARPQQCGTERKKVLGDNFNVSMVPTNVVTADLSNFFCNNDFCPPIIGNVVVYRDRHHLTVPYAQSLALELEKHLVGAMNESAVVEKTSIENTSTAIESVLRCGPTSGSTPIELEVEVFVNRDEVSVFRGDWEKRNGNFDLWKGRMTGTKVEGSGEYRDVRTNPIRQVSFEGTYAAGNLFLVGSRGPRYCSLQNRG